MDKKKIKGCIQEIKEKLTMLEEMMGGEKKEYTSLDEVREKASESEKDESQAV